MNNLKTGSFLQALRKAKGLTQAELAEYFEISAKTVSKWECGDSIPEIPMLKALADFYEVTVDEILNGERGGNRQDIKTRQTNENYFYDKKIRKLNFALILSLCILLLGYAMIYVLGYTTFRSDVGGWVSVAISFTSIITFIFGVFFAGALDADFNEELRKSFKRRRLWYIYSYVFSFTFVLICGILYAELPPMRNAILTLPTFLWYNLVVLLLILSVASLFPFGLFLIKKFNKKRIIFASVIYFLILFILLYVFFAYVLQEKAVYKNTPTFDPSWMFGFGLFLLIAGLIAFIVSVWKNKTFLYSILVNAMAYLFLLIEISTAYHELQPAIITGGALFDFRFFLLYALIALSILALVEVGVIIYQFVKKKKGTLN